MHTRFWLLLALSFTMLAVARPSFAQRAHRGKGKQLDTLAASPLKFASKYYRVVGLGSSSGDTAVRPGGFPYPTAVLQVLDTLHTQVVVRFPELGMLGAREDTVTE